LARAGVPEEWLPFLALGSGLLWPEAPPYVPEGRVCSGTGAGGSLLIADVDRRMTVADVMNRIAISCQLSL
jgi:hypothetical protein